MEEGEFQSDRKRAAKPSPPRVCLSLPALTVLLVSIPLLGAAGILAVSVLSGRPLSPELAGALALLLVLVAAGGPIGAILLAGPVLRLAKRFSDEGGGSLAATGWREVGILVRALNERCLDCRAAADGVRDSEGRFRGYVETMAEGLVVVDREDRITFANPRFARMLGVELESLFGRRVDTLVAPESRPGLYRESERRSRGMNGKYELEWRREDGTGVPSNVSAAPLRDERGQVAGSFAVVTDLTERCRMEAQLVAAERLKALGELAGGVAHDFNNRLTTILGNAQLLLLDEHPEDVRRGLEVIERSAMAGGNMVKGLIAFTRKGPTGRLETVDLNALVREVLVLSNLHRGDGGKPRKPTPKLELDATRPALAHASELREAVLSVITNAIEAVAAGGEVTIETGDHAEGVSIRVVDTGEGMNRRTRARAFDPFFTLRGPQRTGLGLSIAHGILRRMGGRIEIQSTLGEGTTVEVVLPAAGNSRSAAPPGGRSSSSNPVNPSPRSPRP